MNGFSWLKNSNKSPKRKPARHNRRIVLDTIEYYNKYAAKIFEDTVELDMGEVRQKFLKHLEEGDTILDLGCGSGRDSLAFYEM